MKAQLLPIELAQAQAKGMFTIGEASQASGVSAKMIRYYEQQGLLVPGLRTQANYRMYNQRDLHLLRFIKSARDLGFSMKQISQLVGLWQDQARASIDVKKLALEHIAEMDERIAALQQMRSQLSELAERCQGDNRPDCPILKGLETGCCEQRQASNCHSS